jgi:hypothetical protein
VVIGLGDDQVRRLRLRAQRLTLDTGQASADAAGVVRALCGLQAQDVRAAPLGVRVRSVGLVAADVERARVVERTIVRTWGPRGTLHLLAAEDLGWLLPLLGPVVIAGSRRRYTELGLDEDTCARSARVIREALAGEGPLTRAGLAVRLSAQGIPTQGQAIAHLVAQAALEGILCLGPDPGATPTYVLLDGWTNVGQPLSPDAAQATLAHRFLAAYGPATPADLAAWSGLPMTQVHPAWQSLRDELIEVEVAGAPAWMLAAHAGRLEEQPAFPPLVRLLPAFDTYLLGYRTRDLAVPREHARRVNAGGGIVHPVLLIDGRAMGTWRWQRGRSSVDVVVEPFDGLAPAARPGLEAEVADLARFLGVEVRLRVTAPA